MATLETHQTEPLVYVENSDKLRDRTSSAYRVMALIDAMMHTDDPEQIADFELALEESYGDFRQFVLRIMNAVTDLEITRTGIDAEIERLQELSAMRTRRAERLRSAIVRYMQASEITEVITDLWTIRLRKNPPAVEIKDEAVIPADYWTTKVIEKKAVDKKAIADALKNGVPVEGAALITRSRLEVK